MMFPRVLLAALFACLLFAQQGCLRHAMDHALAARTSLAKGTALHVGDAVQAGEGACEVCAAFAVVAGGAVSGARPLVSAGAYLAPVVQAGGVVPAFGLLAFASRAPPFLRLI